MKSMPEKVASTEHQTNQSYNLFIITHKCKKKKKKAEYLWPGCPWLSWASMWTCRPLKQNQKLTKKGFSSFFMKNVFHLSCFFNTKTNIPNLSVSLPLQKIAKCRNATTNLMWQIMNNEINAKVIGTVKLSQGNKRHVDSVVQQLWRSNISIILRAPLSQFMAVNLTN